MKLFIRCGYRLNLQVYWRKIVITEAAGWKLLISLILEKTWKQYVNIEIQAWTGDGFCMKICLKGKRYQFGKHENTRFFTHSPSPPAWKVCYIYRTIFKAHVCYKAIPARSGNPASKYLFVSVIYLIIFHPLLFLFGWAYWQTIFTDPGHPSSEVSHNELSESFDRQLEKRCLQSLIALLIQINTNAFHDATSNHQLGFSAWRLQFLLPFQSYCSPLKERCACGLEITKYYLTLTSSWKRKQWIFFC